MSIVALLVSALLIAIPSPSSAEVLTCDGQTVTIAGTAGDDVLVGTSGIDVMHGQDGNDILKGFNGRDIMCGGAGDDVLYGGKLADRLFGGAGEDELYGGYGHDWLFGGKDNDYLSGEGGDDFLSGRLGDDRATGGDGADTVIGNEGDDTLVGGPGPDDVYGGPGTDMCAGNTELTCEGTPYDYKMQRFLINQAVPAADSSQSPGDRVGTVEKRAGIVRAFVTGNQASTPSPTVHLYWKIDGIVGKALMTGPATLPQVALESDLTSTFNYEFDDTFLSPGAEMFVVVDRADSALEIKETNNRYPTSGWRDIDTRDVPKLKITLVPIDGASFTQGQAEALFDKTFRVHPVADHNVYIRPAYVCQACTGPPSGANWVTLLNEILTLQQSENPNRMYHAIVPQEWGSQTGIGGIGFLGWPAAVSIPNGETIAHETGHNMTLKHNACSGGEADPDPLFPYAAGSIGNWGYDPGNGTTYNPAVYVDLMTYCAPEWISDFSYGKVLDHRTSGGYDILAEGLVAAGSGTVMQFTGTVPASAEEAASYELIPAAERVMGDVTTEIASVKEVDYPAALPAPGDLTLVGVDASGQQVVSVAFTAYAYDHAPGAFFSFSAELSEDSLAQIVTWKVLRAGSLLTSRAAG